MSSPRQCRPGTAIVAALALVALAGALLSVAAAHATAGSSAAAAERGALVVEGAAMRGLAEVLAGWPPAADSLPEGAFGDRVLFIPRAGDDGGLPLTGRLRVQRIGPAVYAVTIEIRTASSVAATAFARRRMRLLVRRDSVSGPSGASPVTRSIPRWAVADLY